MQGVCPEPAELSYLIRIVNCAKERHLKESRIKDHHSPFNILKILSSFKEITADNIPPHICSKLYNWILLITKYFNPQTYE